MLNVTFLGVSTLLFDDGTTKLMIDGFLSRPSRLQLLLSRLMPDARRIDAALERAKVAELEAIFVAHSHYDHVLDTATVARRTGAKVFGSRSTANVMYGESFPRNRVGIFDGKPIECGRFKVTPYATPHSRRAHFRGTIDAPLTVPARVYNYRGGGNYSFLFEHTEGNALVVTSCNYADAENMFAGARANTVFLAVGRLGRENDHFADEFWCETVQKTKAKRVIPMHWDDFTKPLAERLDPMPWFADNFRRGWSMIMDRSHKDGVEVHWPKGFETFTLSAP